MWPSRESPAAGLFGSEEEEVMMPAMPPKTGAERRGGAVKGTVVVGSRGWRWMDIYPSSSFSEL